MKFRFLVQERQEKKRKGMIMTQKQGLVVLIRFYLGV
jgi:hypothetical protein